MPLPQKEKVTKVCIDDFAIRKRHTYGTVMVDIESRRVIDLLPSREIGDVAEWLKTYPNLSIVSRDGSVSYHSAISQADSAIVQISDRFHLLKGFTDAAKKFLTRFLSANFRLPQEASHYAGRGSSDYWDKDGKEDIPTREHKQTLEKKKALVKQVRELKEEGWNNREIAEQTGISRQTVAKYLRPGYNPVNALYNTTYPSKIKPYAEDIKRLLSEGKTFCQISSYIREKGYKGADSTIRMYATRERKLRKEAGEGEKIERRWLIKLLYKPADQVKGISQEQLDQVISHYPIIGRIYDVGKSFKETLFAKKTEDLENWMEECRLLQIEELNSFVNGIERDKDAVKHAIQFDYNNGLAEGSVNKLKVIKRIMYGRNSFELLKSKLLRRELKRKIN